VLSGEATNSNFIVLVNILCHSDSSPPLTACTILVIVIDSSFVEQVEEYTCLNTDSSEILVSNIK
jgi:hypothetical protein